MAMSVQTSISTAPAIGYAGMLDSGPCDIVTGISGESSASIPFGKAVVWDPSGPVSDYHVTLPANQSDKVRGLVVHSHAYARAWTDADAVVHGQLDGTGLLPGTSLSLLRKGRMLVVAASAVSPGDRLYVRRTAGVGETLGALEDAADSTDMIDCTAQGVWLTTAAAGDLAWIEVDFTNEP